MRRYETTFVVNPQADDAAIDLQVVAVADLVKTDGGKILHERRTGTRRLAYPINGLVQGFFTSLIFDAEATVLPKLERHFKLEEPYMRYLTIRYDGPLPSSEDETAPAAAREKVKVETDKPAAKPQADAPAKKVETKPEPKPVAEKPVEEKPVAEAPAVAEPTPATPLAAEPPAEPAKPTEPAEPTKPADPADEEL